MSAGDILLWLHLCACIYLSTITSLSGMDYMIAGVYYSYMLLQARY